MPLPHPLPETGAIFLDARGAERAMRVSWHSEKDLIVLSLWRDNVCTGSFRLGLPEAAQLMQVLQTGLDQAYADGHPAAARAVPVTGHHARHARPAAI
ncbi:hypothetical protein ENKNEFLB_00116 [Nocardioides aquaticus]|uniref:Uncharacterized protein n=1 Tax=Nocardioides aquaticus TaxID=160826 RepID=A0ABX8ECY7_9ACTN|nr:hypothetical protein [Nocardioides aquaticus]QVT77750.1 hypothetical protein ENKNEFLB_00116 [Nocardioides aquaticus]